MQNDRNFINELKHQYHSGGMYIKLIFVNVIIFLLIGLIGVVARLSESNEINGIISAIFTMETDVSLFLTKPWGLFTSMFSHFGFMHLAFNMLMLFFMGRPFEHYFGSKRLLTVYIVGGLVGGLFELLAHNIFPSLLDSQTVVLGASGSIMAIFIGLAFYKPNLPLSFFGLFELKIIYLGLIYLILDIVNLGAQDGTAHFAHLGGAIVGVLAAQQPSSPRNIISRVENIFKNIVSSFSKLGKKSSTRYRVDPKKMSDEDFNVNKKKRQEKTDQILDKISKSGYESLTKKEKEFLFNQSNKNS